MFRDDQMMGLALERFEVATIPARPSGPADRDESQDSASPDDSRSLSLVAPERPLDGLADLGLVTKSRSRDDLAILGLARSVKPRRRTNDL